MEQTSIRVTTAAVDEPVQLIQIEASRGTSSDFSLLDPEQEISTKELFAAENITEQHE